MKKTILTLAAVGAIAAPSLAADDIFEFAANTAEFDNIRTISQLYERLDEAVLQYCDRLVDRTQVDTCHEQVLTSVVDQFDNQDLSDLHARSTGSDESLELTSRDDGV
ncbi:hypothetical protein [Hyphobacterium sp.]|uniref:hypothetical protein n=1 Tax=Hyphobacterium sp. TaxID=2004662 RepID=UPI003BAC5FB7